MALSGGVDSAVAAALLQERGHDVFGLTMLLKEGDAPDDAARVAESLKIPLRVLDLRARFASCVVEPFVDSYLRGETPNPCVHCNRCLKFGDLMKAARALGATALATGHYARRLETPEGPQLHAGADPARDQSYFLFDLSREQLDFLRLPLGGMTKEEARRHAAARGLPVAAKPDSQDICFVPGGDYAAFLEKRRPGAAKPGDITDEEGRVLGRHEGLVRFTVGQRRGLNIGDRKGDQNEPLFVLRLDAEKNRVIVGPRGRLAARSVFLRDVNWIAPDVKAPEEEGLAVTVRLRSTQPPAPATFFLNAQTREGRLALDEPAYGVAPGQAGVIYHDSRVLGGGWIGGGG